MGLASALSTALTGMNAAETTIDVVGNNVANANTVGFKSSKAVFATQFLQTSSLGSAPTDTRGGTNPRQTGLGTKVAEITPNFTQGTIQSSSSPSDLAIQGDGFFIVQGANEEKFYTRNGILKTNSQNELVTSNGQRLLGQGVDSNFQIQNTKLTPIKIPLGAAAVAQATQNVTFAGTLSPTGDESTVPEIIRSAALGDSSKAVPPNLATGDIVSLIPPTLTSGPVASTAAGTLPAGNYAYKVVEVFPNSQAGPPSATTATLTTTGTALTDQTITLGSLPALSSGAVTRNIYRSDNGGTFKLLVSGPNTPVTVSGATFTDTGFAQDSAVAPETLVQGNYSYFVTYYNTATGAESRPTALIGPQSITVSGRRIELKNLPSSPTTEFNGIRVYRNSVSNSDVFHLVSSTSGNPSGFLANGTTTFTDGLNETAWATQPALNFDNPPIGVGTRLIDVVRRDGANYNPVFGLGSLDFTGKKGGRTLDTKTLQITNTTTVQDLANFVSESMGIRSTLTDPNNPLTTLSAGGSVDALNGRINFTGNRGTGNALAIDLSSFKFTPTGASSPNAIDLGFTSTQAAKGSSILTDFIAYDSLGIPVKMRVTAILEKKSDTETTYRWFADSADNQVKVSTTNGTQISPRTAVGTGIIKFDSAGNVIPSSDRKVSVSRDDTASSLLEFNLDFSSLSGLASDKKHALSHAAGWFADRYSVKLHHWRRWSDSRRVQ